MDDKSEAESIREKIKKMVVRVAAVGMTASVSDIASKITKEVGLLDEKWVHYTTIELLNNLGKGLFTAVAKNERVVFIPHCLRNISSCKAVIDDEGYHCAKCGGCIINKIVEECERNGMKWFIVGGGSQVVALATKYKPKAVIGIACFNELKLGVDKMTEFKIPCQGVLLRKVGCVNTEVDFNEIKEKIDM